MAALQLCERPVVLFDFDGTVADTGRAVMTSTRKTLSARGFSEAQMGDLRRMIGPPLWKSFHDFYGFSREESLVVADEYRAFFDELGPEEYPVFNGVPRAAGWVGRPRQTYGRGDVAHGGQVHRHGA